MASSSFTVQTCTSTPCFRARRINPECTRGLGPGTRARGGTRREVARRPLLLTAAGYNSARHFAAAQVRRDVRCDPAHALQRPVVEGNQDHPVRRARSLDDVQHLLREFLALGF